MRTVCVRINSPRISIMASAICSLFLFTQCPQWLIASCEQDQTAVMPSLAVTVPGPDWYGHCQNYDPSNPCINYFGDNAGSYFGGVYTLVGIV